jgi:hypothetical protein
MEILEEEFEVAISDGRRPPLSDEDQFAEDRRRAFALSRKRKRNADITKKIAAAFKCSVRHARMLQLEGTTSPEKAKKLAEILGTSPQQHLRKRLRTGRSTNLAGLFLRAWVPGSSFEEFVTDDVELTRPARKVAAILRHDAGMLHDIKSFEALVNHWLSDCNNNESTAALTELWRAYKLWKIELVAAHATQMVSEGHWADN